MEPESPIFTVWMHGEEKILDMKALLWFSYRSHFPSLNGFTTDGGWGCMLRTMQSLIANVLKLDVYSKASDRIILRLFEDSPKALFSFHRMTENGTRYGHKIGSWLAPGTVCHIAREILETTDIGIKCYVSNDGALYEDELKEIFKASNLPLLILIPMRLGLDYLNPIYIESLMNTFRYPQSVGIIGGRPNSSLYYVAAHNNQLYYLDPHVIQHKVDMTGDDFSVDSYYCTAACKMNIAEMDPSMALAFYCKNIESLDNFISLSKETANHDPHCLFSLMSSRDNLDKGSLIEIVDDI